MADEAALRAKARNKEAQKAEREQEKKAIGEKISRLKEAEKKVKAEKKTIKTLKKEVYKQRDPDKTQWDGDMKNKYKGYVETSFKNEYETYFGGVDNMHDAIIRKITELQNEASDLTGLIGELAKSIKSLWGEIRALFN